MNWNSIYYKLAIRLVNRENIKNDLRLKEIKSIISFLLKKEGKRLGEIEIILVSDTQLLEINKHYLNKKYFTDVIAFNYNRKDIISGDIFVSADTVKRNARRYGKSFNNELVRVILHGVLHLTGYADDNEGNKEEMRKKEEVYIEKFYDNKDR